MDGPYYIDTDGKVYSFELADPNHIRLSDGRVIPNQSGRLFAVHPDQNTLLRKRPDGHWDYDPTGLFIGRERVL